MHLYKMYMHGVFQVAISILCREGDAPMPKRMKYSDGLVSKHKDDGIYRCLLAAITPGSTENYDVLNQYLSAMNLQPREWYFCTDMKVINIALGLMPHSSRHPCFGCNWINGSEEHNCELRTFEGIVLNYLAWIQSGGDPKDLKSFFNCRSKPLGIFPSSGTVALCVPPPTLHLEIGLINLLWSDLLEAYPAAAEWAARLHIAQAAYFGGHFEGCHFFL